MTGIATCSQGVCAFHRGYLIHDVYMQEGIQTLSVRAGVPRVFWLCIVLLEVAYAGAICACLFSSSVGL